MTDTFQDTESMTANKKKVVADMWVKFLDRNMSRDAFTNALYKHLSLHCQHIAHVDREGFYDEWFVQPQQRVKFMTRWCTFFEMGAFSEGAGSQFDDLHNAMYSSIMKHGERIYDIALYAHKENLRESITRMQAQLQELEGMHDED